MRVSDQYKWRGIGRKALMAALLLVLGGIFVLGQRGLLNLYRLERTGDAMRMKNDSLDTEIRILSERLDAFQAGDSLEVERIARHWGMIKPGEEVYLVKEESDTLQPLP
ncbi:hypothetical protein CEE37_12835 [candidate division LCP-89 bacterium B3_LCP]|uniref:Septum formation initiator n=1 Tax=candidate division LCP-89 bacterium B3_LCP TaxID=2012998 RepID=A0A532UTY4_UNCL8|nr:MAG: hypothetical protein CEE37_12835 [candidate division LCP-89 bacterium B3_LCP]